MARQRQLRLADLSDFDPSVGGALPTQSTTPAAPAPRTQKAPVPLKINANPEPDGPIDPRYVRLACACELLRNQIRELAPSLSTAALDHLQRELVRLGRQPAQPVTVPADLAQVPFAAIPALITLPSERPSATTTGDMTYQRSADAERLLLHPGMQGFTPSDYQLTVFDFVWNGAGDAMVSAVAGSGKTTTLVRAAKLVKVEALFVAFNKHIAEELQARLAGTTMTASTIHSLGRATLAKKLGNIPPQGVRGNKYYKMIQDEVGRLFPLSSGASAELLRAANSTLRKLVDFTRLTLTDPRDALAMDEMCAHYGITIADDELALTLYQATARLLDQGAQLAEQAKLIDFTDMIYLPLRWGLQPKQFKWVFVDECQDLNAAQRELVMSARAPGGRMLFVGDARQSLYGFAGADSNSFNNIQQRLGAAVLPLSVSYRCPSSVVALAKTIVPQIEPAPNAKEGVVGDVKDSELIAKVNENDLILCRLTAPLISLCLKLIGAQKTARVRGREIGKTLTELVNAVESMPGYKYERFGELLDKYYAQQEAKLAQREDNEAQLQMLTDKVESVRACYESPQTEGINSAAGLCAYIESLFSDDKVGITLCTVHRAKGLEFPRVFIYRPDKLPLSWPGQQEWEKEQELNLLYVAYTRAMSELYFVQPE